MRKFRRTTLITIFCLAVLAGLGLSRKISFEPPTWGMLIATCCLLLLKPRRIFSLIIVILLGLSLGLWRGGVYMQKLDELKTLSGQKVTIEATATSDAIYANGSQLEFTANHARLLQSKELAGNFKVSGFGEPMVYRGDRVQVSGKLYPMRGANQARIAYAQLKRTGLDSSWINNFTRRLSAGMQTALPEPNSSFGLGLLIGQRNTLPSELTNQLVMVGLVHIVAVSGYNLTILVRAMAKLKLGSKYQRLLASLLLIGVFILMTGFAASIVRAAIVSILSLWAWYFGRKIRPVLILAFTAAITALVNPFYIWGDLGWYLSFLAFYGVLIIAPLVARRLFARRPRLLMMVVLETLAAEIMALPLIMATFNQLSLVGLLTNVLVVPLIPFAMLFSVIAAAAGMLVPALAGWLAWPANLLLTYILDIVRLFAKIPSIFLHKSISTTGMLYFYGLVLLLVTTVHRQRSHLKTATPQQNLMLHNPITDYFAQVLRRGK
ncbi:ComEC/Rec2 family competence protein [Candidatus Saccharibacteria bacterium]|nr:ComEC/Rec2 family competence protein [Candidatus Saccharibacteria bacterium]